MSAAEITALFGGIVACLSVLATLVLELRHGRSLKRVQGHAQAAAEASEATQTDVAEVRHALKTDGYDWQGGFAQHFGPPDPGPPPHSTRAQQRVPKSG